VTDQISREAWAGKSGGNRVCDGSPSAQNIFCYDLLAAVFPRTFDGNWHFSHSETNGQP